MRLLIFAALIYIVWRALRSLTKAGAAGPGPPEGGADEVEDVMLKDPYCNIYFPSRSGIRLQREGKDLYFCSEVCRDRYIETHPGDEPESKPENDAEEPE